MALCCLLTVSQACESTHDESLWNLVRRSNGMESALEKLTVNSEP